MGKAPLSLNSLPILYTFRRCPYAIRARMAIKYSGIQVELREVVLKNKPIAFLQASPGGTVPVLVITSGTVLHESADIIQWALAQSDHDHWLSAQQESEILAWVQSNDEEFKPLLDRYKYAIRYPEPMSADRDRAAFFLQALEQALGRHDYLCGPQITWADIAVFPFVRQWASVDKAWFDQAPYPHVQKWLDHWLNHDLFVSVMAKYSAWEQGAEPVYF